MSENKILILELLRQGEKKNVVDVARHFCGDDRYGYMEWYKRLDDLQTDGYVIASGGHFPECDMEITPSGEDALEQDKKSKHDKCVENIRYWVTTAIAVVALVLAGISLAAQLGLVLLPKA